MAERGGKSRQGGLAGGGLLAAAVLVFLALSLDGRLYWHDVRYLYATAHYGLGELFAGVWNPQYGEPLDAGASGAFYLVKLTWLALLESIWSIREPHAGGLELAVAISIGSAALSAPALAWVLRRALPDAPRWLATGAAVLLAVSPTLPYLAGKLLAEVVALPLELAAIALALRSATGSGGRGVLALMAAAAHVAAVCARPNVGILAVAFFAASSWAPGAALPAWTRRRAVAWAAAALTLQLASHAAVFAASGVGWEGFKGYLSEFVASSRSPFVSILGGLAAGGALWPLAALAARSPQRSTARFLAAWLLLAGAPTLAVVGLYQVEARYLIAPLAPLAALAALGAAWLVERARVRTPALSALAVAVVVVDGLALSVLPYEVERRPLDELLSGPELRQTNASLLVPWAYSDYHYLVTIEPERAVYFVHVPRHDGQLHAYTPEWRSRIAEWYGDRVLDGADALRGLLRRGPVYYLAWGVHPPLERWSMLLARAELDGLSKRVRALGGMEHDDQSWVVDVPGLRRETVRTAGIYRLERVSLPAASSP